MRKKLDAIWNTPGIACPNHVARWHVNANPKGTKAHECGLWCSRGRKSPAPRRVGQFKKRGYSDLLAYIEHANARL